ncbi:MAG: 7TM-DISM domain-containing protein [Fibrobacteres bacterium]|nr:7TM-DISM domain-containing protein [Fibrobacterota bacterium]
MRFSFLLLITLFIIHVNAKESIPGLDLSNRSFSENQTIQVDGKWLFYFGRLINPADTISVATGLFSVPGYWNEYSVNGQKLPVFGCATYKLRLKLPQKHPPLNLTIPEQLTAWKLWFNDSLYFEHGTVSAIQEGSKAGVGNITLVLPDTTQIILTIQVSNYLLPRSGLYASLILGSDEAVHRHWELRRYIDILLIGALLILFLYNFIIFLYHRSEKPSLLLSGICLLWAIRFLVFGMAGRHILLLLPNLSYSMLLRMEIIPLFTLASMLLLFGHLLFPNTQKKPIVISWVAVSALFTLYALLIPLNRWGVLVSVVEILNIIAIIPFYIGMARAIRKGMPGSTIISIGFALFMLCAINDALYDMRIIFTEHIINFGILALALSFSLYLAKRASFRYHYATDNEPKQIEIGDVKADDKTQLAVKLLQKTMTLWEKSYPDKGKIGFARESELWQIYMNRDGWERTQTLDKYLNADTFPQKPRWSKVYSTVEYILANCDLDSGEHDSIKKELQNLKKLIRTEQ